MTVVATGRSTDGAAGAVDDEELTRLDAWWRKANHLAVGQIDLMDNALLRRPLAPSDVKPRPLGHWGTIPGLTFVWLT